MVKILVLDVEANDLDNPTRLWCICGKDFHTQHKYQWLVPDINEDIKQDFLQTTEDYDYLVLHYGISYDLRVLKLLLDIEVPKDKIRDTWLLSVMDNYNREGGHSLENWGIFFDYPKNLFSDFSRLSQELVDRCHTDVEITARILQRYIPVLDKEYVILEHQMQFICELMHDNGFYFNKDLAESLLDEVKDRMSILEEGFQKDFPPELKVVNTLGYRKKKDGEEVAVVQQAKLKYPKTKVNDGILECYDWVAFKPGSPQDRIDRLWQAGWKPWDKTKGHIKFLREKDKSEDRKERFEKYGWVCNEDNLSTLPEDAPEAAHNLAEWLTLEGRRSSLVEWLGCYNEDTGRIHGRFQTIGSWTQRLSHRNPNEANIPAVFHDEVTNGVAKVKHDFDGRMRECWTVPNNCYLVGTDADGIQLRVLTHLMESEEYRDAILSGSKENETDIHNMNKRATGVSHCTRDMAKTFIYAFLLGAGGSKVGSILSVAVQQAYQVMDHFTNSIPGLAELKNTKVPQAAAKGFFIGLDGRKVRTPSQHKTLAGMLQNGETILMKKACILWHESAYREGLEFKLLTFPHDEWQTEVKGSYEDAERLGELQRQALRQAGEELGLFIQIDGSPTIGTNWKETH